MTELVTGALFMFIFKEKSRNAYDNDKCDDNFRKNVYHHFKFRLPHPDTSDEVLRHIPPNELEDIKATLFRLSVKLLNALSKLGKRDEITLLILLTIMCPFPTAGVLIFCIMFLYKKTISLL